MGWVVILGSVLMLSYETPPETMVFVGMKPLIFTTIQWGMGKNTTKTRNLCIPIGSMVLVYIC